MLNEALILPAGWSEFDRRFASTLQGFEVDPHPDVFVAAALVSAATGQGRIYLALEEFAEARLTVKPLSTMIRKYERAALGKEGYRMLEVRSTTHNEREVTANVKWQRPDGSTVVRGGVGALLKEDH